MSRFECYRSPVPFVVGEWLVQYIDNETDGATGCFCTSVAPRPSVLASQSKRSGRDLKAIMSQSGKAKDRRGCEFRKESANDVSY